jgi:hypothetical protein
MPRKKKTAAIEVLRATPQDLEALIAKRVEEAIEKLAHNPLEPWFESRDVTTEMMRRQCMWDKRKHAIRYERYGCISCGKKKRPHSGNSLCPRCRSRIVQQYLHLKREWDREHPDQPAERDLESITRKMRLAERLLGTK